MGTSWYPTKDADLLSFSGNMSTKLTADPTGYGVLAADAVALATLVGNFDTSYATANDPATRTSVSIAAKDVARAGLIAEMRDLYKKINAANLTADKRQELGLPIPDATPTPVQPPATRPVANIVQASGRTVSVRASDEATPGRRARPAGTSGLEVFSYAATSASEQTPPADLSAWKFEGLATRTRFEVVFPNSVAIGTQVWIAARWYNQRGQVGPISDTASTYVTGGVAQAA